jgi:serine/threonine protein kinase
LLSASGELKIADFGLARPLAPPGSPADEAGIAEDEPAAADDDDEAQSAHETEAPSASAARGGAMSHQVATRWYRAPELLYGARVYGCGVDAWGCGAVVAELLLLNPLFPGTSDIDQLRRVLGALGTPTPSHWPGAQRLPDFAKIAFPPAPPQPWASVLPRASPAARGLVASLLCLDPACRSPCGAALQHPFFSGALGVDCRAELVPGGLVVPQRSLGPPPAKPPKGRECLDVDTLEQLWAV